MHIRRSLAADVNENDEFQNNICARISSVSRREIEFRVSVSRFSRQAIERALSFILIILIARNAQSVSGCIARTTKVRRMREGKGRRWNRDFPSGRCGRRKWNPPFGNPFNASYSRGHAGAVLVPRRFYFSLTSGPIRAVYTRRLTGKPPFLSGLLSANGIFLFLSLPLLFLSLPSFSLTLSLSFPLVQYMLLPLRDDRNGIDASSSFFSAPLSLLRESFLENSPRECNLIGDGETPPQPFALRARRTAYVDLFRGSWNFRINCR